MRAANSRDSDEPRAQVGNRAAAESGVDGGKYEYTKWCVTVVVVVVVSLLILTERVSSHKHIIASIVVSVDAVFL